MANTFKEIDKELQRIPKTIWRTLFFYAHLIFYALAASLVYLYKYWVIIFMVQCFLAIVTMIIKGIEIKKIKGNLTLIQRGQVYREPAVIIIFLGILFFEIWIFLAVK